ncbi:response regulator transcription factor [soil metagenome]
MVFILDDDKWVRYHMTMLLQAAGYATKSFASGEEFFTQEVPTGPCCLLLDVNLMGRLDGLAVQSRLTGLGWALPIIFITAYATVPLTVRALKAGAEDLLIKPVEAEVILPAVERAMARSREQRGKQRELTESRELIARLTEREQEVLTWVIAGTLNKQTAAMMGISERTVKAHRASIMEKLNIASLAELVRLADKAGVSPRSK